MLSRQRIAQTFMCFLSQYLQLLLRHMPVHYIVHLVRFFLTEDLWFFFTETYGFLHVLLYHCLFAPESSKHCKSCSVIIKMTSQIIYEYLGLGIFLKIFFVCLKLFKSVYSIMDRSSSSDNSFY